MSPPVRLLTRIALFAALIYVLSWATAYLPNVNPIFFLIFAAGYLWGLVPGLLVGAVGMALWTAFHPFGPAPLPVSVVQVIGAALSGTVGGAVSGRSFEGLRGRMAVSALGVLCSLLFFLPVTAVDAWLFQPFWPRFVTGLIWIWPSVLTNLVIFPLLFSPIRSLYVREQARLS